MVKLKTERYRGYVIYFLKAPVRVAQGITDIVFAQIKLGAKTIGQVSEHTKDRAFSTAKQFIDNLLKKRR